MKQYSTICTITLAVVCVIALTTIYKWKQTLMDTGTEGFTVKVSDKFDPGVAADVDTFYSTGLTEIGDGRHDQGFNVNQTQLMYKDLVHVLQKLSADENTTLKDVKKRTKYFPQLMTDYIRDELDVITDVVLKQVNDNSKFDFHRTGYDNILQYIDGGGNVNYIYDFFVQDPYESINLRFQANVIKFVNPGDLAAAEAERAAQAETCTELLRPGFKTYPIGYPSCNQMIPLPSQVVSTGAGGFLLSDKGINVRTPLPIAALHINSIRIFNSNLVVNADQICQVEPLDGVQDTTIHYGDNPYPDQPYIEPSVIRNPWPKLEGEPYYPGEHTCPLSDFKWDRQGVMEKPCKPCAGIRDPRIQQPFRAEFWPSNYQLPRNRSRYSWLFNLWRSDPIQLPR